MQVIEGNWYDYPDLYDIVFEAETKRETAFVIAAAAKYGKGPLKRILEPACGTGRLVVEFAKRGYKVVGFDGNEKMVEYTRARLAKKGLKADIQIGDLADFHIQPPVDLAYCFCNTFRHLTTEASARQHLESMAKSLKTGGIYLLGLHMLPPDADLYDSERWKAQRGKTTVNITLKVAEAFPKKRIEILRTILSAKTPTKHVRVRSDYPMRTYSAVQLKRLLKSVPALELVAIHDFWLNIDDTFVLDDDSADTLLVLRKV